MNTGARTLLDSIEAHALLAAAPDACLIVDSTGRIRACNQTAADIFAVSTDDLAQLTVEQLLPAAGRQRHLELRSSFNASPTARPMGVGLDLRAQRPDGSTFPVDISLSPIEVEGETYTIAAVRDVTEAAMLRSQIAATRREAALTAERERMARDLHDTVIQEVFAVGLSLQSLAGRTDDAAFAGRVDNAIEDLDRVIRDIRTAIFGLTNDEAWGQGFRGEVLRIAAAEAPALGFEPRVDFQGPTEEIDAEPRHHLLACLREALSNVARHADAQRCDVVVSVDEDSIELRVEDDGSGFAVGAINTGSLMGNGPPGDTGNGPPTNSGNGPPTDSGNGPPRDSGNGIANLKARARELGGTCQIISEPSAGTTVAWLVPREQS